MTIGDKIPEILGIDQDGREIKASDYRGRKIVLYSYPKANTSGCTAEACSLQAHKEELAAAGYDIIGVSKDKQALQKKFADAKTHCRHRNHLAARIGLLGRKGDVWQKVHWHSAHHLLGKRGRHYRKDFYA